ncbi:conserved hypothetical protein [Trichinella spiralis]|uniref:hypothetical protein n=1 Tax=Trichinella spiralis TaxID=6334 RepID=UPI0001EFEC91|nr:conserved hypothetical protein [Trichinella spiralis]
MLNFISFVKLEKLLIIFQQRGHIQQQQQQCSAIQYDRTLAVNVDSAGVGRNGEEHLLEWRLFRTGSYFRQYPLKESLRNGGSTVHMTTLFHIHISFVIVMHHCKFSPAPSRI